MNNKVANLLTDESVMMFADGTIIRGANEVSQLLINACVAYNKGYIRGVAKGAVGVIGGTILIVGTIKGVKKVIENKKLNR